MDSLSKTAVFALTPLKGPGENKIGQIEWDKKTKYSEFFGWSGTSY